MATDDVDILARAEEWRRSGLDVAIATVIETFGSAPRPAGAHLVVEETGRFVGSVSAGCVEGDVVASALDAMSDGASRILEFGVADEVAWRAGLSCGGRIAVHIEKLDDARFALLAASNRDRAARRAHSVATPLDGDGAPRLLRSGDPLGSHAGESGVVLHEGRRWFVEERAPVPRLLIAGAVHVAQVLAPMARLAGFDVIVIDPRTAYSSPERFPDTSLDPRWPEDALPEIGLDASTAVAVLTHDPRIDDAALKLALASDCFYIGALGSRATHARRVARLLASGVSAAALARVRTPIGLDIGALSPADIAVSVLGEIVLARRRKPLRAERGASALGRGSRPREQSGR
jgi:xanthine dehydrogenase accessory factor